MKPFDYRHGELYAENVPLSAIAAGHGTPAYVYSRAALETHWRAFDDAFASHPHLICYAVKANSNLAVLNVLARIGAGFDIVSLGELERVLAAGGDPHKVVFSGIGKQAAEIERALALGIHCFNVESEAELRRISAIASAHGMQAPVSLRVNPDVDAQTHPYISTGLRDNKFGITMGDALALYQEAVTMPGIRVAGIDCHIGSQLTSLSPFLDALDRVLLLVEKLRDHGIELSHLDLGGGLGVCYRNEAPPSPAVYAEALLSRLRGRHEQLVFEPGRAIAANAGVLLTRVELLKPTAHKRFAVVDAAMNDLIRPALYEAWMDIVPAREASGNTDSAEWEVVGPVCETGDFLGKQRMLALHEGDLLAIKGAGAYGFVMSSNYNSRNRAPELMVDGERVHLIRRRETLADQLQLESLLP